MDLIINKYLNEYHILPYGKNEYECKYGNITFIKENCNVIIVYEIYIKEQYRRQGMCHDFIVSLIQSRYNFLIVSVLSKILYYYLMRFNYNGRKFRLTNKGFLFVNQIPFILSN